MTWRMRGPSWPIVMALIVATVVTVGSPVAAQSRDSVRTGAPTDTTKRVPPPVARPGTLARNQFTPPLTPKRAFLYSAMLPGLGQARLDRGSSGALFASVELAAMVMVRRSLADLREARRFRTDTLPANFLVNGSEVGPQGTLVGRYTSDLIRTRRLHVEDWLAVIAFNHLLSGADAFVSAQLWQLPVALSATPSAHGTMVVATIRF